MVYILIIAAGFLLWRNIPTTENPIEALERALEEEDTAKPLEVLEPEEELNMDEKHELLMYQLNYDEAKEK